MEIKTWIYESYSRSKILHMLFRAINQQNYYVYHTNNSYELPKLQHTETKTTIQ